MKKIAEFFSITRVKIELFFPKLTDVLSTDTPTQLAHGILLSCSTLSILLKMIAAVPESLPEYRDRREDGTKI